MFDLCFLNLLPNCAAIDHILDRVSRVLNAAKAPIIKCGEFFTSTRRIYRLIPT